MWTKVADVNWVCEKTQQTLQCVWACHRGQGRVERGILQPSLYRNWVPITPDDSPQTLPCCLTLVLGYCFPFCPLALQRVGRAN